MQRIWKNDLFLIFLKKNLMLLMRLLLSFVFACYFSTSIAAVPKSGATVSKSKAAVSKAAVSNSEAGLSNSPSSSASSSGSSSTSSKPDATQALKAILAEMKSLKGSFSQRVLNEKGKVLQQSSGQFWLKKGGLFRWEVKGNDHRLVVGDGKKIWDYDIDLAQVMVQDVSKGESSAPIFFLTGETQNLSRDFKITRFVPTGSHFKGSDQCFELKPLGQQAAFQWLRLGFKEGQLKDLEMSDQLGQRSVFKFTAVTLNASIPDTQFKIKIPKDVDVVEAKN